MALRLAKALRIVVCSWAFLVLAVEQVVLCSCHRGLSGGRDPVHKCAPVTITRAMKQTVKDERELQDEIVPTARTIADGSMREILV